MVCKKCGAVTGANVPVCPVCGAPLVVAEAARNPKPTDSRAETPAFAPAPQVPRPVSEPQAAPVPKQASQTQVNPKYRADMKPQNHSDLWEKASPQKQPEPAPRKQPSHQAPQQYQDPWAQPDRALRQDQNSWAQPGNPMPPQYQDPWAQPDRAPRQDQSPWAQPGNPMPPQYQDPWVQPDRAPRQDQDPWAQPGNPMPPQYQDPWMQPNQAPRQDQGPWAQPGNPVPQYQDPWAQPGNPVPPQYSPRPVRPAQKENSLLPLILTACGIAVLVIVFAAIAVVLAGKIRADKTPDDLTEASDIEISAALTDPQADYDAAAAIMDAGSYREAAGMFEALGDFSDSAAMAEECLNEADYADAQLLLEAGNYQDAVSLLQQLGDYKDSADLLAQCSLCLPQSVLDELDNYFRQTLQDTFNGASWSRDYLDSMELLGRYELISRTNGPSDNVLYLVYRVTAHNSATGTSMDYYWFGRCEDVSVSDSGEESDAGRTCFTNGAGDDYKLYISGSSYYYYGFSSEDDFYVDQISPLETDYYQTWTPAE